MAFAAVKCVFTTVSKECGNRANTVTLPWGQTEISTYCLAIQGRRDEVL